MQPIFRKVLSHAVSDPDKPAIITGAMSITYGDLATRVDSIANALTNRFGVKSGDRVVLQARSHADFVCTYLANHCIGAVNVPLDPQISAGRFEDIVQRIGPRVMISETATTVAHNNTIAFSELTSGQGISGTSAAMNGTHQKTADILFTTGTSGHSKGVVLSHRAVSAAVAHINEFMGLHANAVEVLPLPLSHSFGLGRVRCVLSAGGTLVLIPGFVNAAKIFAALSDFNATGFASVPTGISILLNDESETLRQFADRLEYVEIGSSRMALEQKRRLMEMLPNTRLCMHYGLTEASRSAYLSFHEDREHLESIGKASPRVEIRIVDDDGNAVADGEDGHIEIRGEHLMTEYWQDPRLTQETLRNGWMRTGDIGKRVEDGYYFLNTRASDIINVGGRKVSPEEIETILSEHPAIAECACVGVADPDGLSDEIVSVFLVPQTPSVERPKFAELATLLRRSLEPYKIPRKFTWVEDLPKSSSGKLLRRYLRNQN